MILQDVLRVAILKSEIYNLKKAASFQLNQNFDGDM